ncbi:MAG: hypothetical protein ACKO96_30285, partial [Flammeovirgaceae bacterium]
GRLNKDERGKYVNKFDGDDQIIAITTSGNYKITSFDLTNRYEPEKTILLEKFNPKKVISAIYWDGESKQHFVKRFLIETTTPDKEFNFISEGIGSRLEYVTTVESPEVEIELIKNKNKEKETELVNLEELIDIKGWKSVGNRLSQFKVTKVKPLEEPEENSDAEEDATDEKATGTGKGAESPKKKSTNEGEPVIEEDGQTLLFSENEERSEDFVNNQTTKTSTEEAKQTDLFSEEHLQKEKEIASNKHRGDDKTFGVGETIDLDI